MTDNVVSMRGTRIIGRPDQDIIDTIKMLLAKAESGELRGFAYVTVVDPTAGASGGVDVTLGTGWTGGAGTRYTLASAIAMLSHRYNARMLEG